jgi:hypothetical protein
MVGAVEEVARAAGPSSVQPVVAAEEEAPAMSLPAVVLQEHNAPEGTTRAASPKIQEVRESSGVALPQDVGGGDGRVLDLARVPWMVTFEVGDDIEDDEEAAACNTLERGLVWARRAFDELILPATSVSFLCTSDSSLISFVSPRCVTYI